MKPATMISFLLMFSLLANLFVTPTATAADLGKDLAFQVELKAIANKTYKYFQDHTDPVTGMTYDETRYTVEGKKNATHTSPTNIGMYMMSTVSAQHLGIISEDEAVKRIQVTLNTLEKLEKWNGLFYNWYNTKDGSLKKDWG
jgi:hypothetical protein